MAVKIAIAQLQVREDPRAQLQASLDAVRGAAQAGAQLVAFPETWLPGYPAWLDVCRDAGLWDDARVKAIYRRHAEAAITVPGPELDALCQSAREQQITVVMGAVERIAAGGGHGTLYNVLLTIGPDGALLNHHRKVMPTYTERLVWGPGDARGLQAVDTPHARVGGLICWEHWMPLARQAMHESREQIHIAAWPHVKEMNLIASRHYAFEGRCFVVCTGALMRADALPAELERSVAVQASDLVLRGGSCVIGPDGQFVVEPVYDREELIVTELYLGRIVEEQMALDVTGHYARPDLLRLQRVAPPGEARS